MSLKRNVEGPWTNMVIWNTGNVAMSLKRKIEEEQGRSAPKAVVPAGVKAPKPDTTVGTDLAWLRDVRSALHCTVDPSFKRRGD